MLRLRHLEQAEMCERWPRDLSLLTPISGRVDEPLSLLFYLPGQGVNWSAGHSSHSHGCGVTRPWERAMLLQP